MSHTSSCRLGLAILRLFFIQFWGKVTRWLVHTCKIPMSLIHIQTHVCLPHLKKNPGLVALTCLWWCDWGLSIMHYFFWNALIVLLTYSKPLSRIAIAFNLGKLCTMCGLCSYGWSLAAAVIFLQGLCRLLWLFLQYPITLQLQRWAHVSTECCTYLSMWQVLQFPTEFKDHGAIGYCFGLLCT